MTIPSRPAPPPPGSSQKVVADANSSLEKLRSQLKEQQQQQRINGDFQKLTIKLPPPTNGPQSSCSFTKCKSVQQARYIPVTDWDDSPFSTKKTALQVENGNPKKLKPPRPPPPKLPVKNSVSSTLFEKITVQNSLTNIICRKKSYTNSAKGFSSSQANGKNNKYMNNNTILLSENSTRQNTYENLFVKNNLDTDSWNSGSNSSAEKDIQLISFDSPTSSPTFTQKSNSDCLSVDSFSSDSNFSSPNNGNASQSESGFEDDFTTARSCSTIFGPLDPWETHDTFGVDMPTNNTARTTIGTAPVRNLTKISDCNTTKFENLLCNGKNLLPPTPSLKGPTIIKPKISQKPRAPKPPLLAAENYLSSSKLQLQTPKAPADISLLDVISGKVDAIHLSRSDADNLKENEEAYGVALYDFEGAEDGDLSFSENDKIYLVEKINDDWYRGRTRTGCEGIFPANYVNIIIPLLNEAVQQVSNTDWSNGHKIRCLYNFSAEVDGDLELKENDIVTVFYRINRDWLYGQVDDRQGQFPSNFLEYIPDNLPIIS